VVAEGASVTIRNAKVAMFHNHMRLAVDQWGLIEASTEPLTEPIDSTNNLSAIEYELVDA
jgi:replication factor A1